MPIHKNKLWLIDRTSPINKNKMKNISAKFSTTFFLVILLSRCAVNNSKFFSSIESSSDPSYGYTAENPIAIKNSDLGNSINSCYYYLSRLRTSDGSKFQLIIRFTVDNPNYKEPKIALQNRFTGQPFNYGTGPLLDLYILKPENRQDTVKLYMNPYLKSTIKIPLGLKFEK
jgi:hypothetical protein